MLGKFILFLIAWSLLKRVVKAIRPEQARLGGKGGRGEDAASEGSAEGPARDLIPVDPSDPLAGTVLPGSRPGACRDCAATYSLPGDFPTSLAQCDACGGIVEVGPVVRLSSELSPSEPGSGAGLPSEETSPTHGQPLAGEAPQPASDSPSQGPSVDTPTAQSELEPQPEPEPEPEPEPAAPELLDPAACSPADGTLELLSDRARTGVALREAFAAEHQGLALQLVGTVQRVESYGHDAHFGSVKGPRLVVDTETEGVRAVVLLPEGAPAPERGTRVMVHGRAVGADPYLRALFLAGGAATPS